MELRNLPRCLTVMGADAQLRVHLAIRFPRQHVVEHGERMALRSAFHEPVTGNDQRRRPFTPGEAAPAESLEVNEVDPLSAHPLSQQRAILAGGDPLELEAEQLEMVQQPLRDYQIRALSSHPAPPLLVHGGAGGIRGRTRPRRGLGAADVPQVVPLSQVIRGAEARVGRP